MDEMQLVRDSYPEPAPPTAREIARAKARLSEPPRRSLPRLRWELGGLVAAGAAAAMTITLAGGNTPAPPRPVTLDDRGAILVAAEQAEQQPIGKYWYTDTIEGQSYIMRPKTGTYAITGAHTETLGWSGAKPGMGEAYYDRDLPAGPPTAADAALWRRAGSPSSFRVWSGDHYYTYTTKATQWKAEDHPNPRGGGQFLGGVPAGYLQNLPTDPAKLAEMFLSQQRMARAAGLPPGSSLPPGSKVNAGAQIMSVVSLLGAPIPPKVRAGLIRALAAQPGIHAIGWATGPLGRRGVALASDDRATTITGEFGTPKGEQGTYRSRIVIIFDERTGALLSEQEELTTPGGPYAQMKPGFVINYQADRSAQWTDTKPNPLAELPVG